MILPVQSTTSTSGKRFLVSAASPTATMFSPTVTTDPFQRTWFLGPSVTTIPFSNLVVISVPFAMAVVLTNTASSHCPISVNVPHVHPENEPVWRDLPCPVRARTGGTEQLMLNQECKLFGAAFPHGNRADKALLGADRASDAPGGVRVWMTSFVQLDCEIWAARAVPTGSAKIVTKFRDFLYRRERHEICNGTRLVNT